MIKMKMPGLKVFENRLNRAIKRANEIPEMVQDEARKVSSYSKLSNFFNFTGIFAFIPAFLKSNFNFTGIIHSTQSENIPSKPVFIELYLYHVR